MVLALPIMEYSINYLIKQLWATLSKEKMDLMAKN
jgi:hypothetical protein